MRKKGMRLTRHDRVLARREKRRRRRDARQTDKPYRRRRWPRKPPGIGGFLIWTAILLGAALLVSVTNGG